MLVLINSKHNFHCCHRAEIPTTRISQPPSSTPPRPTHRNKAPAASSRCSRCAFVCVCVRRFSVLQLGMGTVDSGSSRSVVSRHCCHVVCNARHLWARHCVSSTNPRVGLCTRHQRHSTCQRGRQVHSHVKRQSVSRCRGQRSSRRHHPASRCRRRSSHH